MEVEITLGIDYFKSPFARIPLDKPSVPPGEGILLICRGSRVSGKKKNCQVLLPSFNSFIRSIIIMVIIGVKTTNIT